MSDSNWGFGSAGNTGADSAIKQLAYRATAQHLIEMFSDRDAEPSKSSMRTVLVTAATSPLFQPLTSDQYTALQQSSMWGNGGGVTILEIYRIYEHFRDSTALEPTPYLPTILSADEQYKKFAEIGGQKAIRDLLSNILQHTFRAGITIPISTNGTTMEAIFEAAQKASQNLPLSDSKELVLSFDVPIPTERQYHLGRYQTINPNAADTEPHGPSYQQILASLADLGARTQAVNAKLLLTNPVTRVPITVIQPHPPNRSYLDAEVTRIASRSLGVDEEKSLVHQQYALLDSGTLSTAQEGELHQLMTGIAPPSESERMRWVNQLADRLAADFVQNPMPRSAKSTEPPQTTLTLVVGSPERYFVGMNDSILPKIAINKDPTFLQRTLNGPVHDQVEFSATIDVAQTALMAAQSRPLHLTGLPRSSFIGSVQEACAAAACQILQAGFNVTLSTQNTPPELLGAQIAKITGDVLNANAGTVQILGVIEPERHATLRELAVQQNPAVLLARAIFVKENPDTLLPYSGRADIVFDTNGATTALEAALTPLWGQGQSAPITFVDPYGNPFQLGQQIAADQPATESSLGDTIRDLGSRPLNHVVFSALAGLGLPDKELLTGIARRPGKEEYYQFDYPPPSTGTPPPITSTDNPVLTVIVDAPPRPAIYDLPGGGQTSGVVLADLIEQPAGPINCRENYKQALGLLTGRTPGYRSLEHISAVASQRFSAVVTNPDKDLEALFDQAQNAGINGRHLICVVPTKEQMQLRFTLSSDSPRNKKDPQPFWSALVKNIGESVETAIAHGATSLVYKDPLSGQTLADSANDAALLTDSTRRQEVLTGLAKRTLTSADLAIAAKLATDAPAWEQPYVQKALANLHAASELTTSPTEPPEPTPEQLTALKTLKEQSEESIHHLVEAISKDHERDYATSSFQPSAGVEGLKCAEGKTPAYLSNAHAAYHIGAVAAPPCSGKPSSPKYLVVATADLEALGIDPPKTLDDKLTLPRQHGIEQDRESKKILGR